MGFTSTLKTDCSIEAFDEAIRTFGLRCSERVALFYFAGHGIEKHDTNWLVGRITPKYDEDYDAAVDVQTLLEQMQAEDTRFNALILAAASGWLCRAPTVATWRGLGSQTAPRGSIVAFACGPKQLAVDKSPNGRSGMYTYHLLRPWRLGPGPLPPIHPSDEWRPSGNRQHAEAVVIATLPLHPASSRMRLADNSNAPP